MEWDQGLGGEVPPLDLFTAAAPGTDGPSATAAVNRFLIANLPGTAGLPPTSIDATGVVTPAENIDNASNVLDGFVLEVDGLTEGKTFQFNWFLERCLEGCSPIGVSSGGNSFGFGTVNISRLVPGTTLPGVKVFEGNIGVQQTPALFFDSVYNVPDPATFAAAFAAGLTAGFVDPADNSFDAPVNDVPIPDSDGDGVPDDEMRAPIPI